ncbi:MAG: phosphodiester glycosidase family protein [Oscillospiraceae bacterium]|nr:phosphodiester glycosidase family protein [Oscillospiraceae bacterium]
MKKYTFGILFSLFLTAFTLYSLLDVFVIPRTYAGAVIAEAQETDEETKSRETELNSDVTSEEPEITISTYRENDTTIYVADIVVSDSSWLKTAFAYDTYGRNIKDQTSEIALEHNAILAINGDFYGSRNTGFVVRNGVIYRDISSGGEALVIYADGSFEIVNEDDTTAEELVNNGAVQVLSFGPALVENGEVSVTKSDEVGKAMASNPRTAIGIIDENHYIFVVSDGRTSESEGLSLLELAEFCKSLGAETVYNLDGGGSSTMVYLGEVINNPTTSGNNIKEREVSDIVYIG